MPFDHSMGGNMIPSITTAVRQATQAIFNHITEYGTHRVRKIAKRLNFSKSSVCRRLKVIKKRENLPESVSFETQQGYPYQYRLYYAALYHMGIRGGIGAERLSDFFNDIPLNLFVGISPATLRRPLDEMTQVIERFKTEQEGHSQNQTQLPLVILRSDEVFFSGKPILVALDLNSGFIFVEEPAPDRKFDTWQAKLKPRAEALPIKIVHHISDRAQALVKLAIKGRGCSPGADLFHALHALGKGVYSAFCHKETAALDRHREALDKLSIMK